MSFSDTKIKKLILVLDLYRAITLSFYSDFHVRLDTGLSNAKEAFSLDTHIWVVLLKLAVCVEVLRIESIQVLNL